MSPQQNPSDEAGSERPDASPCGTFWGLSVGPGDPDWLTLKARDVLRSVPVVAVPQNRRGEPGMAYRIARSHLRSDQTLLPLALPFVTEAETLAAAWDAAIARVLPLLESGQDVAFLTEGDASFYSTFSHLARVLGDRAPQVPVETVPGVCSPLAAAAALGVPLSLWDEKVAILPAVYDPGDIDRLLDWADAVVLMKVASAFSALWDCLAARQWLDRACLVEWIGSDRARAFRTLEGLQGYRPPYFSLAIVWPRARPAFPPTLESGALADRPLMESSGGSSGESSGGSSGGSSGESFGKSSADRSTQATIRVEGGSFPLEAPRVRVRAASPQEIASPQENRRGEDGPG